MVAARWLFVLGLLISWVSSVMHILLSDRPLYRMPKRLGSGKIAPLRIVAALSASIVYIGLLVLFGLERYAEWTALAILAFLLAVRRVEIVQWPGDIVVRLGKYVPAAACLLAWLAAQPVLRGLGVSVERSRALGWDAACGVMAGAHVLAAIAKLRESGLIWMHPRYQALLVAERGFTGPQWIRAFRLGIARSRAKSRVVGVVGFFTELCAGAFVIPAARPFLLGVIYALYVGFMVLLGYFEIEWLVVIAAVALLAM